ncbi:zinc finger FYVE domain-containing protein 21-like [Centruroides sculpturatus]|uniref:zinc finger FYVE domain-containing protein 21-like n=1 Tax=Centruroides sculpturatus TaxID=218467 RepID=UPI000C6D9D0D|nr:zinc finger FYVE domain-containing protein 21-like [Centruroides sculpturatus]
MAAEESRKRLVKSKSGLRIVNLDGSNASAFELTEPQWTPDKESPDCAKCHIRFDLLTRRHHCRRCGQIYCSHCCEQKVPLPRMCFVDPVRVCDECSEITTKENEFYEKHLKVLVSGANFLLNKTDDMGNVTTVPFFCRLSSDHRVILFDGGSAWEQDPISLSSIRSSKPMGVTNSFGATDISGIVISYNTEDEEKSLTLSVAPVPNHKQSIAWISALQKALKLIVDIKES